MLDKRFVSLTGGGVFLTESDDQNYRVCVVHALVHKLPDKNKEMLEILIKHLLKYVSDFICIQFGYFNKV